MSANTYINFEIKNIYEHQTRIMLSKVGDRFRPQRGCLAGNKTITTIAETVIFPYWYLLFVIIFLVANVLLTLLLFSHKSYMIQRKWNVTSVLGGWSIANGNIQRWKHRSWYYFFTIHIFCWIYLFDLFYFLYFVLCFVL